MNALSKHQKIQLINDLLAAPQARLDAQTRLDSAAWRYKVKRAELSLRIYTEPLIVDSKTGEKRVAKNDDEREQALISLGAADPEFVALRESYEDAQRDVTYWSDLLRAVDGVNKLIGK